VNERQMISFIPFIFSRLPAAAAAAAKLGILLKIVITRQVYFRSVLETVQQTG